MKATQLIAGNALVALALATATTAGAALALAEDGPRPSKLFNQLDTNRDGFVSRGEAAKLRGFGRIFDEADENHDGKLSADEFIKAQSMHERQKLAEYAEDGVITAKVKTMLFKDPEIKALEVSVETYRGRVLLSGFVDDAHQARRAVELASTVRGVESVENALKTK